MSEPSIEPGLLSTFKLYIFVRLGVILATAGIYLSWYGFFQPLLAPYLALFSADVIFLLIFISWSWLRRRLGGAYLPIALMVASAGPILEGRYLFAQYAGVQFARQWMVFPFLSVPLILTAWQYRFRQVIIFCLGTALLDIVILMALPTRSEAGALSEAEAILARTVFFALVGYIVSNLVMAQRRQRQQLAEANRQVVRYASTLEQLAVTQERNRLARELHDTLAHTLSGLAVQLEAIATVWTDTPPRAAAMLRRALESTRTGLDETRRALRDLRTAPLESLGLTLAVRQLTEEAAARGGLLARLDLAEAMNALPPEVEQCFYRVAQEALENVVRHANARWVMVSLRQTDDGLLLEVADDGHGFQEDAVASDYQFGLRGMRERARLIGAQLEVVSRPDQGAAIRLFKGSAP